MRSFIFTICFLVSVSIGWPVHGAAPLAKSLADLKTERNASKDPKTYFCRQVDIVHWYLVAPLSDSILAEMEESATQALRLAKANKSEWCYGNAIHDANSVLGRRHLFLGDTTAAIEHLLNAGRTPGSPQLNNFGPNMRLAHELLMKKQSGAVLEYLESVKKFWNSKFAVAPLTQWKKDIEAGKVPDFKANLEY